MTMVCATDGVPLAQGRDDRWLHTDEIPKGVDPEHEASPVPADDYEAARLEEESVHVLAAELLQHHASIHPASDCEFSLRLARALRAKR